MTKSVVVALATALLTVSLPAPAGTAGNRGSAAGSNATASGVEHCARPLGTLAVVEDQNASWFGYLTSDLRLGSTVPVLRTLVQQSNCFVVVERGRALNNMRQERALADGGELREGSSFGKGQMVAADYTLNPAVHFSSSNTGGLGGALGAFGGKAAVAGALVGGLKFKRASTVLTLIDNRSGVQLAAAQGEGRKTDFTLGGIGGLGALGGYTSTPEGKVIAAAFVDAYNQMVVSLRDYRPQEVDGGLGKGGTLRTGN